MAGYKKHEQILEKIANIFDASIVARDYTSKTNPKFVVRNTEGKEMIFRRVPLSEGEFVFGISKNAIKSMIYNMAVEFRIPVSIEDNPATIDGDLIDINDFEIIEEYKIPYKAGRHSKEMVVYKLQPPEGYVVRHMYISHIWLWIVVEDINKIRKSREQLIEDELTFEYYKYQAWEFLDSDNFAEEFQKIKEEDQQALKNVINQINRTPAYPPLMLVGEPE